MPILKKSSGQQDECLTDAYLEDKSLWQGGEFDNDEAQMVQQFVGIAEDGSYFIDYLRAAGPGEFDAGVEGHFAFLGRHRRLIVDGLNTSDTNESWRFKNRL